MGLFSGNKKRNKIEKNLEKYDPIFYFSCFSKQNGLPIEDQCLLGIALCNDKIIIIDETNEFIIKKEKIKSIKYSAEQSVEKKLESSIVKGIIGESILGVPGAIIGSQPKEKIISKKTEACLEIKYISSNDKEESVEFIYNTVGDNTLRKFGEFKEKANKVFFNDSYPKNKNIEL